LKDFGFVEQYPQRWHFLDGSVETLAFEIDNDEWKDENESLRVSWLREVPAAEEVEFASVMLEHLEEFAEQLDAAEAAVPERELNTIKEYHNALTVALEAAIDAFDYDDTCVFADEGGCPDVFYSYDQLQVEEGPLVYDDSETFTCDLRKTQLDDMVEYEKVDELYSHYQKLLFEVHPETRDACFQLDRALQQCTSYRAHYHEVGVHYAARYLDSVKRVVWIGGGDSM
jgi:hypothetical protein